MPRYYKRKTDRVFNDHDMRLAVEDCLNNAGSIRSVALRYGVTKSRLANYVSKAKNVSDLSTITFQPNHQGSIIFTADMEQRLENYLVKCQKMFYGLTPKKTRELAYEFAVKNNLEVSEKWHKEKCASADWFTRFMRDHTRLAIRKPEATSIARMNAFNQRSVDTFFQKLESLKTRFNFQAYEIFNLDETGVSTVPPVQKVVGQKGLKQVGQVSSRERGESITLVGIISADGNALPPMFVFPRVRLDEVKMLANVSEGCKALVHSTGYMTSSNFIHVLEFFCKHTRSTKEKPVLLIMDNHESHLSLQAINFARDNGIVILTLPPHTSHNLQPLDKSVFGPFKKFIGQGVQQWMINHPNTPVNIYQLPSICCESWNRAASRINILSGFKKCGISPFDKYVFKEEDFLPALVSDRPDPTNADNVTAQLKDPETSAPVSDTGLTAGSGSGTATTGELSSNPGFAVSVFQSADLPSPNDGVVIPPETSTPTVGNLAQTPSSAHTGSTSFYSPEDIWPYPKAQPRKEGKKRKKGKCMIATDTPEKMEKELQELEKLRKTKKVIKRKLVFEAKKPKMAELMKNLPDSSGGEDFVSSEDDSSETDVPKPKPAKNFNEGQFVAFTYKGTILPGRIEKIEGSKIFISSMKKTKKAWRWPDEELILPYKPQDILGLISQPTAVNKRGFFKVPEIV